MQKYNKAIVAVVGFTIGGLAFLYGVNDPTVHALIQLATALGVYSIANK